jgi:hypothetical protein
MRAVKLRIPKMENLIIVFMITSLRSSLQKTFSFGLVLLEPEFFTAS